MTDIDLNELQETLDNFPDVPDDIVLNAARAYLTIQAKSADREAANSEANNALKRLLDCKTVDQQRPYYNTLYHYINCDALQSPPSELLDKVEGALKDLSCLGNGNRPGNSDGNIIAQKALSLIEEYKAGK